MSYSDLIRRETQELAGQLPTYTLIDESELLLANPRRLQPRPRQR